MERRICKKVKVGNLYIGGDSKISVQSMLNRNPEDIEGNICQAKELEAAGCDIIRIAIPNMASVRLINALKENIHVPVVADIHFNFKLAIESVIAGADKVRINPGNIGSQDKIKAVSQICSQKDVPIRIGVNSGSLEKNILSKYGAPTAEALCESAIYNISLLEKFDFDKIIVSVKSSDVKTTVDAYRILAGRCSYPLHVGVTEAGTENSGIMKSAAGIGSLLLDGIGDTIRVSLTADPVKEVETGISLLSSLNIHNEGVTFTSCPTCGRTKIDLINLANEAEKRLIGCRKKLKIAIMGCVVNGPGEAIDADIGVCGGDGLGIIFKKGKEVKRVPEADLINELVEEVNMM